MASVGCDSRISSLHSVLRTGWLVVLLLSACGGQAAEGPPIRLGDARLAEVLPAPFKESAISRGRYLELAAQRLSARPQDRWVSLVLDVSSLPGDFRKYSLQATVRGAEEDQAAKPLDFSPKTGRILLEVDLRRGATGDVWIEVVALESGRQVDAVHIKLSTEQANRPLVTDEKILAKIDAPQGTEAAGVAPVVIGVPFAPGQLWAVGLLSLQTEEGEPIPFQREVTGTWINEGSIQWVQFRAVVDTDETLAVVVGSEKVEASQGEALISKQPKGGWVLRAGPNRIEVGKGSSPITKVFADGKLVADSQGARGLYLVDSKGRIASSSNEPEITIESEGPISASLRIEADYLTDKREAVARHITRLEVFADKPTVKITHTLLLTQDTQALWFREAGWELTVPSGNRSDLKALFGVDGQNLSEFVELPLETKSDEAFVLQSSHPSIGGGKAEFKVAHSKKGTEVETVTQGSSMGDWGGYLGGEGGMFWVVKDAARQHPKEIFVSHDRINLLLFSSRTGEELDFRTEALEKRWGVTKQLNEEQLKQFRQHSSNAAGWSKTHEMLLIPASAELEPGVIAAEANRLRKPVYAMVDPKWIYQSGAMGPLYPYDPVRFPDSEKFMRAVYDGYARQVPGDRYNGFVDYFAGPHYGHAGRYRLTYSLLHDLWLYAARTGDRDVWEFAQGANRAFRDNYINHWDTPSKAKGLFVDAAGGTGGWRKSDFPFYWEENTDFALGTTTSLYQFIWDYQLTGDRRSAEVVWQFAEALKTNWKADTGIWRIFMVLRILGQTWQFTNDPELLLLLEETATNSAYDPEGEFLMTKKGRPYESSLYKSNTDVGTMIGLWELLGTDRWGEMAYRTAEYWWRKRAGLTPLFRISGLYLNFLHDRTGSAAVAQTIDYNLRYANTTLDLASGETRGLAFSTLDNVFQGIPYGMDVVARTDADKKPVASISQFDDYGNESFWLLKKGNEERIVLYAQPPLVGGAGLLRSRLQVEALNAKSAYGLDLVSMEQKADGTPFDGRYSIRLVFPKDAPELVYRVTPEMRGRQFAVAESNIPLVFYCKGYWHPSEFRPAYRYYFNLPKDASNPRLFLEGTARVYQPDGSAWQEGKVQSGMLALPAEQPGLWSFEPVEPGLVKVFNLPPYFSMNSSKDWFDPGLDDSWKAAESEPKADGAPPLQGIKVGKGKGLGISKAGKSTPLFNREEGTLEFFMKPDWSSFDLRDGLKSVSKEILRVETETSPWIMNYRIDPTGTSINMGPTEPAHSFYAQVDTFAPGKDKKTQIRAWNKRQIVESDEWIHVALVWGNVSRLGARTPYSAPSLRIYVNGVEGGHSLGVGQIENLIAGPALKLNFPSNLDAEVRQLRVSSTQRYTENFTSPAPTSILANDEATLFVLPLDNDEAPQKETGVILTR